MRRVVVVLGAVFVMAACASGGGGGGESPAPSSPEPAASPSASLVTMNGTFEVDGGMEAFRGCNDSPSRLTGGYSDIGEGTIVTVYDDKQVVLITTDLTDGEGAIANGKGYCRFSFTAEVPDVPTYLVEVSHRGKVLVQRAQISDVQLTLGG